MLSSAGISLDVEKQSLLQTSLTLQEQLKESQAALLLEQVLAFSLISARCDWSSTENTFLEFLYAVWHIIIISCPASIAIRLAG